MANSLTHFLLVADVDKVQWHIHKYSVKMQLHLHHSNGPQ